MPPCAATECARRGESWKTKLWTSKPSSASVAAAEEPARPAPTTMILYFRLFAGLMSLVENLCFSHFCASGPDGMLELSAAILLRNLLPGCDRRSDERGGLKFSYLLLCVICADDAEVNRNRDQRVTDKYGNARDHREPLDARPPDVISEANRLKHARQPVPEVDEQQRLCDEIKQRHPPDLKAQHHHRVNVAHRFAVKHGFEFGEIADTVDARQHHREMREVIHDTRRDHRSEE